MKTLFQFFEFTIGRIVGAGAILWLAAAATVNAHAQYKYTTLSVPGAVSTYANGIDGTNIVGTYVTTTDTNQGFIYNGSTYTTLSAPGALQTQVTGISGTNIVGSYKSSYGYWDGFEYNGSTWDLYINDESAFDTYPMGVSGNNIVGYCWLLTEAFTNFVYNGSDFVSLGIPGATYNVVAYGVSGTNIVGGYANASGQYGFWYNGQSYVTLSVPGASSTAASGISGSYIVGQYNNTQGFLYNTNTKAYTTFSMPGEEATVPFGISGKFIVGYYYNHSGTYGFLATPAPASLTATNIAGRFKLTISGPSDSTILQESTNVVSWTNVYTNTPPFTFTDSAPASLPCRFYRALVRQ